MTQINEKILSALSEKGGLTEREIAVAIFGKNGYQQRVNQDCRILERQGLITKRKIDGINRLYLGSDGLSKNDDDKKNVASAKDRIAIGEKNPDVLQPANVHAEDAVKQHLAKWLEDDGWQVEVKWGKDRGIDICAIRGEEIWIIEVKGIGKYQPMRVNYFLGALAELLQRMSEPDARYSVAFPDVPQYRGLWNRLPALAKSRTGISALFVDESGRVEHAR